MFYRKFVGDSYLLFRTENHVEKLENYLNKQHKNIKFMAEIDENDSLSFLDITISRENNKFVTSVYCKPTFSGVFKNFESFMPGMYIHGLIEILLRESFRLCFKYEIFHRKLKLLKSIFKNNSYS